MLATGLPRPVTMSYPSVALATKFEPLVMSWKSVAYVDAGDDVMPYRP